MCSVLMNEPQLFPSDLDFTHFVRSALGFVASLLELMGCSG